MLQEVVALTSLLSWCFYHSLQCNSAVYRQSPMDCTHSIPLELGLRGLEQSWGKEKRNIRTSKCIKRMHSTDQRNGLDTLLGFMLNWNRWEALADGLLLGRCQGDAWLLHIWAFALAPCLKCVILLSCFWFVSVGIIKTLQRAYL